MALHAGLACAHDLEECEGFLNQEDVPSDVMPRAAVMQAMATRGEMLGCARIVSASAGPRKATVCSACSQDCNSTREIAVIIVQNQKHVWHPSMKRRWIGNAQSLLYADDLTCPTSAHQRLDGDFLMRCPRTMLTTG